MKILTEQLLQRNNRQSISFAGKPIQQSSFSPDINTPDAKREINELFEKICRINEKTHFVDKISVYQLHKMISDIWKFAKYVEKSPTLKPSGIDFASMQEILINLLKNDIILDLDFEKRKPALDKLVKFGENPQNKKTFKKLYEQMLSDILLYNTDHIDKLNKLGIEAINKLYNSKNLSHITNNITIDQLYRLFDCQKSNKLISKNIDKLENLLQNSEYGFFKNCIVDPDILKYNGDINSLFKELLSVSKELKNNEVIKLKTNNQTGISQIRIANKKINEDFAKTYNFDVNANKLSESETKISLNQEGQKIANVKIIDHKNNANYTIQRRFLPKYRTWNIENQTRIQFDDKGSILWKEILKPSKVDGVFNKTIIDSNKNISIKCYAIKKDNGLTINKNLISPDGTETKVYYQNDIEKKQEIFKYTIIDKDGKTLAEKRTESTYIDKNLKEYTENGKKYLIRYSQNQINVLDKQSNKLTKIDLKKLLKNDSQSIKNILRNLSATELLKLNKSIKSLKKISEKSSNYNMIGNTISSSSDLFVFEHELGHAKNKPVYSIEKLTKINKFNPLEIKHKLSSDKELLRIFEEEKARYFETYPKYITDYTSYFTEKKSFKSSQKNMDETIAEINAIINTPIFTHWLCARTHFLQENFPRTIAYLMNNKL